VSFPNKQHNVILNSEVKLYSTNICGMWEWLVPVTLQSFCYQTRNWIGSAAVANLV